MSNTAYRYEITTNDQIQPHTWVVAGDLVVCLTQEGTIADEVWSRFVRDVANPDTRAVLGLSLKSVSINSIQRKAIADAVQGKELAGVLQSAIVRGILTALGWFGVMVRPFAWKDLDKAIEHLRCDRDSTRALVDELLKRSEAPTLTQIIS